MFSSTLPIKLKVLKFDFFYLSGDLELRFSNLDLESSFLVWTVWSLVVVNTTWPINYSCFYPFHVQCEQNSGLETGFKVNI